MITKYTEYNIICDDCEITGNHNWREWCHEKDKDNLTFEGTELFSNKGKRDLRKIAKEYGWLEKHIDGNKLDICPKCSEKPKYKNTYY